MNVRHRDVALIILKSKKGSFLFQKRDANTAWLSNHWGLFGGGVEMGETPIAAVKRECQEELQYTLQEPVELLSRKFEDVIDFMAGTYTIFIEKYNDQFPLVQCEGQDMKWFTLDEIQKERMWEFDKESLRMIKQKAEAF